jgi:hypothetical protein
LNKQRLIEAIIAALEAELANYARSARAAHAEATDEQSKAENKYDTRGLEASYLARGQSRQAAEVMRAIEQYRALETRAFSATEAIDLGALVTVKHQGDRMTYFVGPGAGGTEVVCEAETVVVITPQSPMGQKLVGAKAGSALDPLPGARSKPRVTAVE